MEINPPALFKQWVRQPPTWAVSVGAFLLCWSTFVVYYEVKFGLNVPPSTSGDEVDYDSIGWELANGRGFQVNTGDADFRRPYDLAAREADRFQLGPPHEWIVTYRPPLYPYAISILSRCFGRQLAATRVMDAAFMAGTLALLVMTLYPRYGWPSVLISIGLFVAVDVRTRLYGRAILTEAMSLFLTSLICVVLIRFHELKKPTVRTVWVYSLVVGAVFGFSLLARTMVVLWIPGLTLIVLWMTYRLTKNFRQTFVAAFMFLFGLGVVVSPWAVRNVQVTGELMPLGTQGLVQLSAVFGDEVWESKGLWVNLDHEGFFDDVIDESQTHLEQEIVKANWSKSKAMEWALTHPVKALALFPIKIIQECRPRNMTEAIILLLACMGGVAYWKTPTTPLMLAILATNFFAIGMTWSVIEGRFLVPVLFPIHFLATIGLFGIWCRLRNCCERVPSHEPFGR